MFKSNLFQSIESVFRLQQIFCILPLKWNGTTGHLTTTRFMKLYVFGIILMTSFINYLSIFKWNCMEYLKTFVPDKPLWTILFAFEFTAIYIQFLLGILFFYIQRAKHIEVLKKFHSIDKRCRKEFGQEVDHRKHRRQINIGIIFISLHYLSGSIFSTIFCYLIDRSFMIPITLVYDFERASSHLSTYMSINYILLIRVRCKHLLKVYQPLQFEYHQYLRGGEADQIASNYFSMELQKVFDLFKETCSLFNICAASFGWNSLLQILKSLSTISLQIYILCTFLIENTVDKALTSSVVLYVLFGELLSAAIYTIVLEASFSTVSSSSSYACFFFVRSLRIYFQVHQCKYAFRSFDKRGKDPNIRRMVRCYFNIFKFSK